MKNQRRRGELCRVLKAFKLRAAGSQAVFHVALARKRTALCGRTLKLTAAGGRFSELAAMPMPLVETARRRSQGRPAIAHSVTFVRSFWTCFCKGVSGLTRSGSGELRRG